MLFNTSRRSVLGGASGLALLAAVPATAKFIAKKASAKAGAAPRDPQLAAALKTIANGLLRRSPEQATLLGADIGANADLASKWSDASPAGEAEDRRTAENARRMLHSIPVARLHGPDIVSYDSLDFALGIEKQGQRFPYGDTGYGGGTPYVVSQQNGAYNQVPEFLDSYHRVEDAAGAAAYVARLHGFATLLDQETARITADAGRGVTPPTFMNANTLGQLAQLRSSPAGSSQLVTSLAKRAAKLGLPDPSATTTKIVESEVYPALDRQIAALKALKTKDDAGVWKLPDGEAYYQWLLRSQTTTSLTAAEIHATGQAQNKAIEAEMDMILQSQGLTKGTVGERTAALTSDARFLQPDTDAGRAAVIAYVQGRIDAIRPRLKRISKLGLKADVRVKRVPVEIQDGAAQGYMNFASPDGKRPAIYYINLKTMNNWPQWTLSSLTAHEAIPGHAWQGAYLAEHPDLLPPTAQLLGFNAFVEGWALYAEQLVDEDGLYENDPFGRLGYLQAQRFRAVRLIVDTGLHSLRWTRDKAIETMIAETGRSRGAITSEVDRYCASPAQACGYKIGHNEIIKQRARAKGLLGPKWDVRDFNDALVETGGIPLASLPGVVDRMVARVKAA